MLVNICFLVFFFNIYIYNIQRHYQQDYFVVMSMLMSTSDQTANRERDARGQTTVAPVEQALREGRQHVAAAREVEPRTRQPGASVPRIAHEQPDAPVEQARLGESRTPTAAAKVEPSLRQQQERSVKFNPSVLRQRRPKGKKRGEH